MTTANTIHEEPLYEESDLPKSVQWALGLALGVGLMLLFRLFLPILTPSEAFTQSEQLSWYLARSSGLVGYLLMTLSMLWGLLLSTKIVKSVVPAPLALTMHNLLSWTAIGLSVFHAGVLLFDKYYTYTITNLLVPFTGPYEPGWVGAGIISFYIMLLTSVSFNFRKQIGQKNWRRLHYLTFLAYVMVTFHGIKAGSDTESLIMVYAGSGLTILFLTIYRILAAKTSQT